MKTFFCNRTVDKSEMKRLIKWVLLNYGTGKATRFVDRLKTLGFHYATTAGISLGIDDLRIPPIKASFLLNAENEILENDRRYQRGQITAVERMEKALDIWNTTNETLKNEVIEHFRETDIFNPVYMMAFSGARGNISQVRQLVGMRGLMADPQGQILDFPIRRNFREGLTVTEYMISCYGARKGLVDTALRTANSGYLTRRLVDVAQGVIIQQIDCESTEGLTISPHPKQGGMDLVGRVVFEDLPDLYSGRFVARKNQDITPALASVLCKLPKLRVRSPLTCKLQSVCQLCYGWNLAQQKLVQLGEAVGVLAAQSIGEPGTQLTMRTFHTGGVFAGEATEKVYAPQSGYIAYSHKPRGRRVVTHFGETAFLTFSEVHIKIARKTQSVILAFPPLTLLFVFPGQHVLFHQSIAELSRVDMQQGPIEQTEGTQRVKKELLTPEDGQIYFDNIKLVMSPEAWKIVDSGSVKPIRHQDVYKYGFLWILAGQLVNQPIGNRGDWLHAETHPFNNPAGDPTPSNLHNTSSKTGWRNYQDTLHKLKRTFQVSGTQGHTTKHKAENSPFVTGKYLLRISQQTPALVSSTLKLKAWELVESPWPAIRDFHCLETRSGNLSLSVQSMHRLKSTAGEFNPMAMKSCLSGFRGLPKQLQLKRSARLSSVQVSPITWDPRQRNLFPKLRQVKSLPKPRIERLLGQALHKWHPPTKINGWVTSETVPKHEQTWVAANGRILPWHNHLQTHPFSPWYLACPEVPTSTNRALSRTLAPPAQYTAAQPFPPSRKLMQLVAQPGVSATYVKPYTYRVDNQSGRTDRLVGEARLPMSLVLTDKTQHSFAVDGYNLATSLGQFVRAGDQLAPDVYSPCSGQVIAICGSRLLLRRVHPYLMSDGASLFVKNGDLVKTGTAFGTLVLSESTAGDIVQGLPKVDELLEAREPYHKLLTSVHAQLASLFRNYAGTYGLREGCKRSLQAIRRVLVDEVQAVYRSQGVFIADKHVEIIVRQMTTKVIIVDPGQTGLLPGDIVDVRRVEYLEHRGRFAEVQYRPILLGITRASLTAESFIAAASFQETKRVLSRAALEGRTDWLTGLKENVILGRLIPAGTGLYV